MLPFPRNSSSGPLNSTRTRAFVVPLKVILFAFCMAAFTGCGLLTYAVLSSSGKIIRFTDVYVSKDGNDAWSGKIDRPNRERTDGPLATLEGAKTRLRELEASGEPYSKFIAIRVSAGTYHIENGFVLDVSDIPSQQHGNYTNLDIRANPYNAKVVLTGGKAITGFQPISDPNILARIDPAYHGSIMQIDLRAQGITNFGELTPRGFGRKEQPAGLELFYEDAPMQLARWPNDGWARIADVHDGPQGGKFTYEGDRPSRWVHAKDVWLHGYWTWDWAESHERAASIDTANKTITTQPPHGVYGYKKGGRYYAYNILEELDQPGEWQLDRETGLLYFWPPGPLEEENVRVSLTSEPLVTLNNTSHIWFWGIEFNCTRGDAVVIKGGESNEIEGCRFRNIGNAAIRVEGSKWTEISETEISMTGDGGIILNGGDRATLTPGNNQVFNCTIHDFGRWVRTYRPAVWVLGVGNTVENNLIYDAPHSAIILGGNEHQIKRNEIHHVCMETSDAGAIYMGRDWTERGNIFEQNYIHNLGPGDVRAIYLDDWASGSTVKGNVLYRAGMGVCVGGGRNNTIENNFFVECRPAIHVDARGRGWAKDYFQTNTTLTDRMKAMNYTQPPFSEKYPELLTLYEDEPDFPKYNRIVRNINWNGEWLRLLDGIEPSSLEMRDNQDFDHPEYFPISRSDLQPVTRKVPWIEPIPMIRIGTYEVDARRHRYFPVQVLWPDRKVEE